jgi:YVTN family beta-propeller protein
MLSRRALLAAPVLAACSRKKASGFPGFAFVANEEGRAIAAVDLTAFAVAKHIRLDARPTAVALAPGDPSVYALTPETGALHQISGQDLTLSGRLTVARTALAMNLAAASGRIYVLCREPRQLVCVARNPLRLEWKVSLPATPVDFRVSPDAAWAALTLAPSPALALLNLETRQLLPVSAAGEYGAVRFLSDSRTLAAADLGERQLSMYDVASRRVIAHLPLAVRPDHLCFNADGGQLFITGEGLDAVVVVYPYFVPQVAETVLAGKSPGPMAASANPPYLFVANPESGDLSILNITTRKLVAVVSVGAEPGYIAVTPDDQYALILNRKSGDMAVLRIASIQPNRAKSAPLFTMIPVGSKPVSAVVRAV